jgi:hypothetical protein
MSFMVAMEGAKNLKQKVVICWTRYMFADPPRQACRRTATRSSSKSMSVRWTEAVMRKAGAEERIGDVKRPAWNHVSWVN